MARVTNNRFTEGLSGAVGDMLFRQVNGKTIVSLKPAKPRRPKPQSALQRANRDNFREATFYAKAIQDDPELKAHYLKKAKRMGLTNAYTAAISEYRRKPDIASVKISNNLIKIIARKQNFDTGEIEITFLDKEGEVIAQEKALRKSNSKQKHKWFYKVSPALTAQAATILVTVTDRVGNVVQQRQAFPQSIRARAANGHPYCKAA